MKLWVVFLIYFLFKETFIKNSSQSFKKSMKSKERKNK
ncbi:hypothetical protein LEP1GSC162_2304 [Leptospira santarosai str. CBC1531]|nr:hypothetical protein LEP1GSC162_2304 [Leptospira santarosai str. CBC1531]